MKKTSFSHETDVRRMRVRQTRSRFLAYQVLISMHMYFVHAHILRPCTYTTAHTWRARTLTNFLPSSSKLTSRWLHLPPVPPALSLVTPPNRSRSPLPPAPGPPPPRSPLQHAYGGSQPRKCCIHCTALLFIQHLPISTTRPQGPKPNRSRHKRK